VLNVLIISYENISRDPTLERLKYRSNISKERRKLNTLPVISLQETYISQL